MGYFGPFTLHMSRDIGRCLQDPYNETQTVEERIKAIGVGGPTRIGTIGRIVVDNTIDVQLRQSEVEA